MKKKLCRLQLIFLSQQEIISTTKHYLDIPKYRLTLNQHLLTVSQQLYLFGMFMEAVFSETLMRRQGMREKPVNIYCTICTSVLCLQHISHIGLTFLSSLS